MRFVSISLFGLSLLAASWAFADGLDSPESQYAYTIGQRIGQLLKGQVTGELDADAFAAGVKDYLNGSPPRLSKAQMKKALQEARARAAALREKKAAEALEKGKRFREQNAKKAGVKTLADGLQYEVLKEGDGESPKASDRVQVHYRGTLIDGKEFDSSYKRGKPAEFSLKGVVPGFREAITRMKPGAKWRVVMPPELAYGKRGAGADIGPNETLVFEIELLKVLK